MKEEQVRQIRERIKQKEKERDLLISKVDSLHDVVRLMKNLVQYECFDPKEFMISLLEDAREKIQQAHDKNTEIETILSEELR